MSLCAPGQRRRRAHVARSRHGRGRHATAWSATPARGSRSTRRRRWCSATAREASSCTSSGGTARSTSGRCRSPAWPRRPRSPAIWLLGNAETLFLCTLANAIWPGAKVLHATTGSLMNMRTAISRWARPRRACSAAARWPWPSTTGCRPRVWAATATRSGRTCRPASRRPWRSSSWPRARPTSSPWAVRWTTPPTTATSRSSSTTTSGRWRSG